MIDDKLSLIILVLLFVFAFLLELFWVLFNELTGYRQEKYYKERAPKINTDTVNTIDQFLSNNKVKKDFMKLVKLNYYEMNKLRASYKTELAKISKEDNENIERLDDRYIYYYQNYRRVNTVGTNEDGSVKIETI